VAGSAVKWARDQIGIIKSSDEIGTLASKVDGDLTSHLNANGRHIRRCICDCIFRTLGTILASRRPGHYMYILFILLLISVGITGYTTKAHICRAILESIAFQTKAILEAMRKDSGYKLAELNVLNLISINSGRRRSIPISSHDANSIRCVNDTVTPTKIDGSNSTWGSDCCRNCDESMAGFR
jgi:hypothetical protein